MEFSREQIIDALEHCISSTTSEACKGCPLSAADYCIQMENALNIYSLALIKELIAENENLKLEYEGFKAGVKAIFRDGII